MKNKGLEDITNGKKHCQIQITCSENPAPRDITTPHLLPEVAMEVT